MSTADWASLFSGLSGLVLLVLSVILAIYWLFMPMMIISRLDKLLKLTEEEAERLRATIRAQAPQAQNAPSTSKPIPPEAERFYVANGKDVVGPHDREKLAQLRHSTS